MAEPGPVSSFPLVPQQYVCKYTDENVKNGRAPKPPPPPKDAYMMFGGEYRPDDVIIHPLEAQNILRLHPHNYDHRRELKKLNFSIVANFIDLIQLLVQSPDSTKRIEKIDHLTLLFIHMHHLINEFRPHQARESLRVMMEVQKKNRLEVVDKFQSCLTQVVELLNNTITALPSASQLDTKLLVPKSLDNKINENFDQQEIKRGDVKTEVKSETNVDDMMCDILDALN